jgi:glycosyltransferase involved in cell wall biosynthesis
MPDLAVVLISKDQEWNIARLIKSALQWTASFPSREIVLVDSASVDNTVEVARNYPINIIRLQPDQRLTAAAGRYVGYQKTSGDLILFLDGDMELCKGWVDRAIAVFQSGPDIAAVTGQLINLPTSTGLLDAPSSEPSHYGNSVTEVSHGGGAAMYRRSVLKQVGTFNPYIYSDEEPELCLRIRYAGYSILSLEHPIAYHYSDPSDNISTLVARWRRNLYLGSGQAIRYHFETHLLWPYIKERGYGLLPGLGLVAGLISLVWSLITQHWKWFGFWLLLLGVIIVADAWRKRSLYLTFSSLLKRMLILHGTVKGLLSEPLHPDIHPILFDIVKWEPDETKSTQKGAGLL